MRIFVCILFFSIVLKTSSGQNRLIIDSFSQLQSAETVDSLRQLLTNTIDDSNRVLALHRLTYPLLFSSPDSAMILAQEGLKLAQSISYAKGEVLCKTDIGAVWWILGDYPKASILMLENLKTAERLKDPEALEWTISFIMAVYRDQGEPEEALKYALTRINKHEYFSKKMWNTMTGSVYLDINKFDSALFYLHQGDMGGYNLLLLGNTYAEKGNNIAAINYYEKSIQKLKELNNLKDMTLVYVGIAVLYEKENKMDSAIYAARKGFDIAEDALFKRGLYETSRLLSRLYERNDKETALHYLKISVEVNDSLFNLRKITGALELRYNEQLRDRELAVAIINYKNRLRTIALSTVLGVFFLAVIILYRNNIQKQKAKVKIEKAYNELESTQTQLVQREKMASLGELTAGIAHEIQNPLNFVNNFSEINKELLIEMNNEIENGNMDEVKSIAKDVIENQEKINHHGKRADAIVKGMLQHSRVNSGVKEPTNINALADEYLRLAYHGLRAKDKSFNATMKTDYDETIGNINIIPQDIGRVILNLITNAFYVVSEKKTLRQAQDVNYEPTVSLSTKKINGQVLISVRDNGYGISQNILDKIFQPFFTTKPTGQGTGLGLSLSYDIVKAHSGELKVETKEGEGSVFQIYLPVN